MIHSFTDSTVGANTYLVWDEDSMEGFVLDLAVPPQTVRAYAEERGITVKYLILSHGHFDHAYFAKDYAPLFPDVPLYCHENEKMILSDPMANVSALIGQPTVYPSPDKTLADGDTVTLGKSVWHVIHTPGHTPGCICLYNEAQKRMITGDTLFADGGFGRFDFKYGDKQILGNSLERLFAMDGEIAIYPGHGRASTLRDERHTLGYFKRY